MARFTYDRLSTQDATFLFFENDHVHMHVAATQIFDNPRTTRCQDFVGKILRH